MVTAERLLYTIGLGARKQEEFLRLLQQHGVRVLADIRRWPTSKTPHFRREALEQWLPAAGIEYVWFGESLGGYRSGGYPRYMTSACFQQGMNALLTLASQRRVCVMCLEISPLGCHRRHLTQAAMERGWRVRHILSATKIRDTIAPSEETERT